MARLGTLAQFHLDHLDLIATGLFFEFFGIKMAVISAAAEIPRADFIDQISAAGTVIPADPAFAGIVGKSTQFGTFVERADGVGGQRSKAHR